MNKFNHDILTGVRKLVSNSGKERRTHETSVVRWLRMDESFQRRCLGGSSSRSQVRRFLTWQREEEGFAACCFGANCKRDSRAKAPRNARERVNRVWVLYGFCPLFGRENCMSVYAVEFYGRGRRRLYVAAPAKTANGFCIALQPPVVSTSR